MKKFNTLHKLLLSALIITGLTATCGREGPEGPPDLTAPQVSSTSPYYQEQDVPINTSITINFSEPMNASSLHSQSFALQEGTAAVSGTVSCSGSTAVFKPAENLKPNSSYNVVIGVDVKDIAGNAMTAPYVYSFRTGTRLAAETHTITVASTANGSITPGGTVSVNDGAITAFTVTPNSGYHIGSVSGCGGSLSGSTYTTGPVTAECTVTASFAADEAASHIVTARVTDGGGSITPASATVRDGGTASFTVTPDAGWRTASVSGCGGSLTGSTYKTGAITGPCEVAAYFERVPPPPVVTYTISAEADSNGTIAPEGAVEVTAGADQSFRIETDGAFIISSVEVDGENIHIDYLDQEMTYTFYNVNRDHTIKAKFKRFWKIEASFEGNGSIIPSGDVYVADRASQSFDMVPGPDSFVAAVLVDTTPVGPIDQYLFTNVTSTHTIHAIFAEIPPPPPTGDDGDDGHDDSAATASAGENGKLIPDTSRLFSFEESTSFPIASVTGSSGKLPGNAYCVVTARFAGTIMLTVTPSPGQNGEIIPGDPQQVPYNEILTFTIVPAEGYSIYSVTGCEGTLADNIYTTGPVIADCTITVVFNQIIAI